MVKTNNTKPYGTPGFYMKFAPTDGNWNKDKKCYLLEPMKHPNVF